MKLYNKDELIHSRIFFDKQPPIFLTIFILGVLFLLALFLLITSIFTRTYVVSAGGIITTEDLTFVGSFADGIVVELLHFEGDFVEEGDVLFTVSSGVEGLQYQTSLEQLAHQLEILAAMDLFEQSIEERENHMVNYGIWQEYYARIEHYLLAILNEDAADVAAEADLNDQRNRVSDLNVDIKRLNGEISTLEGVETNLELQIRYTPVDIAEAVESPPIYYNEYGIPIEFYQPAPIMIPNPEYTRLTDELERSRINRQTLEAQRDGYVSERDSLQSEITSREREPDSTNAHQTRIQLLAELGASRTSAETRIVELEAQIETHRTQDGLYEVQANQTGYVHYLLPLRAGMMIQRMQSIAEISMNLEDDMQVEVFIPAHQISRIQLGQEVNVAINGANVSKYGTIEGELISIDVGTMTQESSEGNMVFYRGIISISEVYLQASNGDTVYVLRSMPVTARIVYERETYLNWILNMLQFRNE